jgi:hypothetical protein
MFAAPDSAVDRPPYLALPSTSLSRTRRTPSPSISTHRDALTSLYSALTKSQPPLLHAAPESIYLQIATRHQPFAIFLAKSNHSHTYKRLACKSNDSHTYAKPGGWGYWVKTRRLLLRPADSGLLAPNSQIHVRSARRHSLFGKSPQ